MDMEAYLENLYDQIDATMFSGDSYIEKECRDRLTFFMERWGRELKVWEETEKEREDEDE